MCDCHLPSRRAVLRTAFGVAVSGAVAAALPARADAADVAGPPLTGSATATDITGTAGATPKPGDAVYGLTWLAGDTHVHNDHSADGSFLRQTAGQGAPGNLSVSDQIGQATTTGLAWMPLTDHRTFDQHWDPLWTSSSLLLVHGEEANGSPHATILGGVDEVTDPAGDGTHRHVQQSLWEAHAQGAVWGTAHPTGSGPGPEADCANVIGANWIETFNPSSDLDGDIDFAESRWNDGVRGGAVGACDNHFRELWGAAGPGQPTTWVLASAITERAILDGLRAGRTTAGTAPEALVATARKVVIEGSFAGYNTSAPTYEAVGGDETPATAGAPGQLRVTVSNGSGTVLLVWAAPGRSGLTPLISQAVTLDTQVFTVPVTVPTGAGWWRAELRGAGTPGLTTIQGLEPSKPTGVPTLPPNAPGVPSNVPDPSDQPLATSAPVFTYTVAPAVPVAGSVGLPAPSSSAQADDASAPVAIGSPGTFTSFPDLAVAGGVAHLVAEQHTPGATHVVYRRGSGSPVTLSTGTSARFPRVAVGPNGSSVFVVWEQDTPDQLPHRQDIYLAASSDGGRSFAAATRLTASAVGGRALRPDVTVLSTGQPVFVWQANAPASAFDVFAQVGTTGAPANVSGAGKTIAAASATDTRSASYPASIYPSVTATPGGGAAVIWQDDRFDPDPLFTGHTTSAADQYAKASTTTDPDAWEPMISVLPAADGSWGPVTRVAPDPASAQRHPSVVARGDGVLVAAWDAKSAAQSSGSDPRLRYSLSRDGGRTWSPAAGLDDGGPATSQRPRLGLASSGAVRVVWHDSRAGDWRWRVRSATFTDASGWTGMGDVSTAGNSLFPSVAGDQVTWTTDRGAALQRDQTHQVVLAAVAAAPAASLPESPWAVALPVAGLVAAGAVRSARRSSQGHGAA